MTTSSGDASSGLGPGAPGGPAKRATILDVAAAAGVSRQTVTRAMNAMPGIRQETRERVQETARQLGYTPSRFAKGLVQGARTSVGLAIPDLTNPYYPAFASSVVELATQRGWHVVMDDYGHGGATGVESVQHLAPQVDAVIGYLGGAADEAQAILGRRPLVVLDQPAGSASGGITFDYAHAARTALEHLQARGCRQLAYIDRAGTDHGAPEPVHDGGPRPGPGPVQGVVTVRGQAFARGAAAAGVALAVSVSPESAAAARQVTRRLLDEHPGTDGIVVFNDLMAAGVLKALADSGRAVPADCAVIGMDGIPLGELLTPELTTLALDLREVGRAAVELLDGLLTGSLNPAGPGTELVLRHQLVLRQSA
ncbi:LacI family transcriptional regulator [Arthrobacter sp. Soil736]|uniref:LacI family DNA-binding transcriptional regulator n=1 Tax=Arthrobacter sp. Soil736 TaxID=1736395 RepID=UPI0006F7FB6F|nr:LacI family DNA-binding transcriptional regulator [Arthrobacter sp. Soil736]KRE47249.1 LacI family transcriptional regulator [Arthrobacter sp. Soil736]